MQPRISLVAALLIGASANLAAQGEDRYVGTYVGTNIIGPVTVEVVQTDSGLVVTDRSSAVPMRGLGRLSDDGILSGQYVTRLLGIVRRHRFSLTPEGNGLRYRTTGQNTPLERYRIVDDAAESRAWFEALVGRELARFDRYSSGGSTAGGYQSQARATLCADGLFRYQSSSSTSISGDGISASGSSSDQGAGRWRIFSANGGVRLELRWTDGRITQHALTNRGSEVYVDGDRYLRGDRVC